ncbi:hypothetical protein GCM10009554_38280 [Kribbella koreensis]|uniref:Uncharacterized protein n=1 Tax=Kribbella koreensis TaxID=57909 RepID=A0ABN1QM16_9ACTN
MGYLVDVVDRYLGVSGRCGAEFGQARRVRLEDGDRVGAHTGMRVTCGVLRLRADQVGYMRADTDSDQGRCVECYSDGCVCVDHDD